MTTEALPKEREDVERQVAWAEAELSRLLEWVRAAESRLALVLPLSTAMLGALALLAPPLAHWTVLSALASFLAALLLILSLTCAACATFPRTTGPKGSLIYFGGITTRDLPQYEAAFTAITPTEYLTDLLRQCHRNAQIAQAKYTWIKRGMACLFLAALPWLTSLYLLYAGATNGVGQ